MAVPETYLTRIRRWADRQIPAHARDQIRIDVDVEGQSVTILECRPPWRPDVGRQWIREPVARFRYSNTDGTRSLYWSNRNSAWHIYDRALPTLQIDTLLDEVDADPTGIFWG